MGCYYITGIFNVRVLLQGPVLSANKKLVVAKLVEEASERKVKGEAKKEKHLVPNYIEFKRFFFGFIKGIVSLCIDVNFYLQMIVSMRY